MTQSAHKIAIIAGDGIGKEVVPAGLAAIEAAIRGTGISIEFTDLPWGCDYYLSHGRMMDEDGFDRAAKFDAIYLGAIGSPNLVSRWKVDRREDAGVGDRGTQGYLSAGFRSLGCLWRRGCCGLLRGERRGQREGEQQVSHEPSSPRKQRAA